MASYALGQEQRKVTFDHGFYYPLFDCLKLHQFRGCRIHLQSSVADIDFVPCDGLFQKGILHCANSLSTFPTGREII